MLIPTRSPEKDPGPAATADDGISLTLHEGETLAVVGESGSGKSTLGRMIMRLTEPDSGAIRLGNQDLRQLRGEALRQVGGGKVTYMSDPVFVGSDGGLALALDAPDTDWERLTA